ncbi:carboxypeptidase-like regulatory domain-containing protein [Maribacter sp. 2308TA10-17]|uniref:carboxypeptidase-like regulatory domain-containing protein n=1 Tax=Maribacter sp. 2308TA10-17 TaxID=3386276 RepID=UPI0039BCA226
MKSFLSIIFILFVQLLFSQAISGNVYDAETGDIIEGATVYFDGTSIGTVTNEHGDFSIDPKFDSNAYLVISHIGYKAVTIHYQKLGQNLRIALEEDFFEVPEVVLISDTFSRKQKLEVFRLEFLGESKGGLNSKILNEHALDLYFNMKTNILLVHANEPLVIVNDYLKYRIKIDLVDFQISFRTQSLKRIDNVQSTVIYGHTFFTDVTNSLTEKQFMNRRNYAYRGSIQHFMRTMWNQSWLNESYELRENLKKIDVADALSISAGNDIFTKRVFFKLKKFKITYRKGLFKHWSSVELLSGESINIDKYGSYMPYLQLKFAGEMADDRIGDLLPLDFEEYLIVD